MAKLTGTNGNDRIDGTSLSEVIRGLRGDDLLNGMSGSDRLFGGQGNDVIHGGLGNDQLQGGIGADRLYGDEGNDTLLGNEAADRLFGGAGDDSLMGGQADDILAGGSGNDVLRGNNGADLLDGGDGDDVLFGGTGFDTFIGGAGVDTVDFSDDPRGMWIDLRTTLEGDQAFAAYGEPGRDWQGPIETLTGIERVNGTQQDDTFHGGDLGIRVNMQAGDDVIYGSFQDDTLIGGDGNDRIFGASGDNRLFGSGGDDRLETGDGDDLMTGGAGNDVFAFDFETGNTYYDEPQNNISRGSDVVADFQAGDKLHISGFSFNEADGVATYYTFDFADFDTNADGVLNRDDRDISLGAATVNGKTATSLTWDFHGLPALADGIGVDATVTLFGVTSLNAGDFTPG